MEPVGTVASSTFDGLELTQGNTHRPMASPTFKTHSFVKNPSTACHQTNLSTMNISTDFLEVMPSQEILDLRQKQLLQALNTDGSKSMTEYPYYEKTPEQREELAQILQKCHLARFLKQKDIEKVVNALEPREYVEGENLV